MAAIGFANPGARPLVLAYFLLLLSTCTSRKHELRLQNEARKSFELSKFGFLRNGFLRVEVSKMVYKDHNKVLKNNELSNNFGFSLEKTASDGISPYMEQHAEQCILHDVTSFQNHISVVVFIFDLTNKSIVVNRYGSDFDNLSIGTEEPAQLAREKSTPNENNIISEKTVTQEVNVDQTLQEKGKQKPNTEKSQEETKESGKTDTDKNVENGKENENETKKSGKTDENADKNVENGKENEKEVKNEEESESSGDKEDATMSLPTTQSPTPTTRHATKITTQSSAVKGQKVSSTTVVTTIKPTKTHTKGQVVASTAVPKTTQSPTTTTQAKGQDASSTVLPKTEFDVHRRRRRAVPSTVKVTTTRLPLYVKTTNMTTVYYGNFTVMVKDKSEEGLYNLYFHNCANYMPKTQIEVDIHVKIVEKNEENYLSAGEEPLPIIFSIMAVVFFLTAGYWFHVLRQNREYTFKVHYMMLLLILLKSMDLVFEGVNYHFIGSEGIPSKSWAVMFYITHLLKGALLFTTIVLIGTGYFFVKHVLSDRDKKIFLIVIPLQILANSAQIVMESTEEAKIQYATWKELFILVDLLCCGAILFPVVWSIKHLQEASKTDGKAAINLVKLKLFRHFYVMIVCYIYFTRIIVYLVKITVPFQYMWFDEFFKNVATYCFFVLTGYKFRPAPDNPYLHVSQDSDDEAEMDEVVTTQGLMEGVTRLHPTLKNRDTSDVAQF